MIELHQWADEWNIPKEAIYDLMYRMGLATVIAAPDVIKPPKSEGGVAQRVRLEFAKADGLLWRNNVGSFRNDHGVPVRYGLANESTKMNEKIKSSDLIGIKPVLITQEMVGYIIGQFVARETKKPGWVYKGNKRERAQLAFMNLVISKGGDAKFTNGDE
jgi:hypothetical protein